MSSAENGQLRGRRAAATAARIEAINTFWSAVQDRANQLGAELADAVDERFLKTVNEALYAIVDANQEVRR